MRFALLPRGRDTGLTRSRKTSRSNSAKTASIPTRARPLAVVRSRAWASDTKPTPSSLSSYTEPMRPATIAPSDSRRQTQDDVELAPARRAEQFFSFWPQVGAGPRNAIRNIASNDYTMRLSSALGSPA